MNLVTGASGFVGSWLMQFAPSNTIGVRREIPSGKFDTVIHAAIAPNMCEDLALLDAALKVPCNRFIYISSGIVTENVRSEYRHKKVAAESACRKAKMDVVIARLYSFIGPRLNRFAPYEMMAEALTTGKVTVRSGAVRSYMYAEDMAKRIWTLHEPTEHVVGSREPVTMVELATEIAKQCNAEMTFDLTEQGSWYVPEHDGQIPRPLNEQVRLTLGGLDEAAIWAARCK